MRGLKALVIGMGVLIVAGLVFLVYAIIDKAGEDGFSAAKPIDARVSLPAGAEVVETSLGDGRIAVRLRMADGSGRLLLFDAKTGRPVGRIDLTAR